MTAHPTHDPQGRRITSSVGNEAPDVLPARMVVLVDEAHALFTAVQTDPRFRVELHRHLVALTATGPAVDLWPRPVPAPPVDNRGRQGAWPVLWFFALGLCVTAAAIGVAIPRCEVIGLAGCLGALVVGAAGLSRHLEP